MIRVFPDFHRVSSVSEVSDFLGRFTSKEYCPSIFEHLTGGGDFLFFERNQGLNFRPLTSSIGEIRDLTECIQVDYSVALGNRKILKNGGWIFSPILQYRSGENPISLIYFTSYAPLEKSRLFEDLEGLKVYSPKMA